MHVILRSDQKLKQNHKDVFLFLFIHKNCTHWGKNLDPILNNKIFLHRLSNVEAVDHSSSSCCSFSRRWWSEWSLEIEDYLRKLCFLNIDLMKSCTDLILLYLRILQGHSRRNLIDFSQQDDVVIPDNFFENICHVGCAINSHSIKD